MTRSLRWPILTTLMLAAWSGGTSVAEPISIGGLTFSDELGGFRILQGWGTGSADDPIVIVEEITGPQDPVLVIQEMTAAFGNRVGTQHLVGFALRKIVVNRTDGDWQLFEMELREVLAVHSPYGDGLSFGQASTVGRPFQSSVFAKNEEVEEPYDSVSFGGGLVRPNGTVTFDLIITDTSPVSPFLLLQQPTKAVAGSPTPSNPRRTVQLLPSDGMSP